MHQAIHSSTAQPTALALLQQVESLGYSVSLELGGTAHKWVTGKNLFVGACAPGGLTLRDSYGPVRIEVDLRAAGCLLWQSQGGEQARTHSEALRNTIMAGKVRRNSALYRALALLARLVAHAARKAESPELS